MSNAVEKILYRTAAVIFEELSFLLPSPVDNPIGGAPAIEAAVSFCGPFSGALLVRVTQDIAPILCANMLGNEQAPDENMKRDAVGEITNVICGNALPVIADSDEPFHLEFPKHFEGPVPAGLAASSLKTDIFIGLDSGKAEVMLFVTDGVLE